MTHRAIIDASAAPRELLLARLRGVPLFLWVFNGLRKALPTDAVALAASDPEVMAIASRHGLRGAPGRAVRSAEPVLVADPLRPFCSEASVRRALDTSQQSMSAVQTSPVERVVVKDDETLELARAVACGLAPDHPAISGAARLRLPLSVEIRAIVTDVDGCLTNGGISYMNGPEAGRTFSTHDGLGHGLLRDAGIRFAWLSATTNGGSIAKRAEQLGVEVVDAGSGDKGPRFSAVCDRLGVDPGQTLYIGDDRNDLPAIRLAGASACPADARPEVRAVVDLVLDTPGGAGAFREAADIVLAGLGR